MADVDFNRLVAAINKLEKTMTSRANAGTTPTENAGNVNELNKAFKDRSAAVKELENITKAYNRSLADQATLEAAQRQADEATIKALETKLLKQGDLKKSQREELDSAKQRIETQNNVNESQDRFNSIIQTSLGLGQKNIVTLLAQRGGFKGLSNAIKENITLQNVSNSLLSKFAEASFVGAIALSSLRSEFIRTTGASEELTDRLGDFDTLNLGAGVGMRELAQAATAVRQGLSGVGLMSTEAELSLAGFVAENERLGIESSTSVSNLDALTKAFGQTTQEAQATSDEITRFGLSLGVSAGQISQDFTEATPFISQFGENAVDVFKDLQIQAQATGVSIGSLISAIEGLDTFEGAATAAAQLNAALGTSLNSFELLEAEGVDKIRMLQQNLQGAGVDFSSLNRFQQRFIAQSAGLSNVEEAARLFSGSVADQAQALRANAQAQQDLDRRRQLGLSIQEKLTKAAEAFATVASPLLGILDGLATALLALSEYTDGWGTAILGGLIIVTALASKLGFLVPAFTALSGAIGLNTFVEKFNNKVKETSIGLLNRQRVAAKTAGTQMIAFAGAIALAGAGLGLAALGMAQFVSAFQGMTGEQILAVSVAIVAFGAAIILFAKATLLAAKVGTPGLIFIGLLSVAFVALGYAINLMSEGFSQIANVSAPLLSLAAAAPGLMAVAASLGAISLALRTLPNEEMINFAGAMAAYADAVEVSAQSPEAVREMKETISAAATIEAGAGLASLFAGMAAMAGAIGNLGQRPVQIRVNERVLGDTVVDVFNDRLEGRIGRS